MSSYALLSKRIKALEQVKETTSRSLFNILKDDKSIPWAELRELEFQKNLPLAHNRDNELLFFL